jgi:hypothetical protein
MKRVKRKIEKNEEENKYGREDDLNNPVNDCVNSNLRVVDSFTNIGPVSDFAIVNTKFVFECVYLCLFSIFFKY